MFQYQRLIQSYSPWLDVATRERWDVSLPEFHRPIFKTLLNDLETIPQIISLTGPRRIGKSTLLKQLIRHLLYEKKIDPKRVVYYSFDDPALLGKDVSGGELLDSLMGHLKDLGKPTYLFLDEIQTLPGWELYLKKYYDLDYPVRVIVSGSATSPIFKKSRESLLGRVKDYHLLPFSFREFLLFHCQGDGKLTTEIKELQIIGGEFIQQLVTPSKKSKESPEDFSLGYHKMSEHLWNACETGLKQFLLEGGFPEVWTLPNAEKKMEYLYDNQIKKVIYEDLVLAAEFRKPEQLKTFYISLLENPGVEVSMADLSRDIGIKSQQIDKYLPLLELTDLIVHVEKFRKSALKMRSGKRKYYLTDLSLRNSVMRIGQELFSDATTLGFYAENLVFNALRKIPGILKIDYYRDKDYEVDFIVQTASSRYWPVEVKYRNRINEKELAGLGHFMEKIKGAAPLVITKKADDYGAIAGSKYLGIPLNQFLLFVD